MSIRKGSQAQVFQLWRLDSFKEPRPGFRGLGLRGQGLGFRVV